MKLLTESTVVSVVGLDQRRRWNGAGRLDGIFHTIQLGVAHGFRTVAVRHTNRYFRNFQLFFIIWNNLTHLIRTIFGETNKQLTFYGFCGNYAEDAIAIDDIFVGPGDVITSTQMTSSSTQATTTTNEPDTTFSTPTTPFVRSSNYGQSLRWQNWRFYSRALVISATARGVPSGRQEAATVSIIQTRWILLNF